MKSNGHLIRRTKILLLLYDYIRCLLSKYAIHKNKLEKNTFIVILQVLKNITSLYGVFIGRMNGSITNNKSIIIMDVSKV